MIDKASEVTIFFNYSPQRQRAFEEHIEICCKENEQNTVEDKDEKRKRKKKLKMLCKTRWVERHDAYNTFTELYTPLVITLTCIAEHSSEFTINIVKKTSSFLDAITEFQFIAILIIAKHVLQYRNAQDIVRGWNYVKITHKRVLVKEIRQDMGKHHPTWFSELTVIAEKLPMGKNHEFRGDLLDKCSEIMFLRPLLQSTTNEQYQHLCLIILKAK